MPQSESNASSRPADKDKSSDSAAPTSPLKTNLDRFFVPMTMLLVAGIVLVSTFHGKESDEPLIAASTDAARQSVQTAAPGIHPDTDENENPAATSETGTATATAELAPVEVEPADTRPATPLSAAEEPAISNAYPQRQLLSYSRPGIYPPGYNDLLERQHRAYFEAMQVRRQHWNRMQAQRAMIRQRMELDREAIIRRMQEIERKHLERPDGRFNTMGPAQNLAGYHPI
jgi:hypothetical protein